MKKLLLFLLLPFSLFGQPLQVTSPVRFLALGDSYTIGESVPSSQNWPSQLRDSLLLRSKSVDSLKIIATTGWRTDNLLNAITNQDLDQGSFNLVSILIGVNNQYQGRPVSQYVTELPQLIDSALRYAGGDTSRLFIVSIPDYAYTPFGQQSGNAAMISAQLDTYNLIARQYADSFGIRFFDITQISRQGLADPALVAGDGLHPSAKQYSMWVSLMLRDIDSVMVATGISEASTNTLMIYPNPVASELVVRPAGAISQTLEIVDLMGRVVISAAVSNRVNRIDMNGLPAGVYTVRIGGDARLIMKE